ENVQQALVRADLELLPRLLINVRRTQHRVLVLHRRQRNRTSDLSARALRRGNNLRCGLIEHAVIVCLQPDAYFFVSYHFSFLTPPGFSGRKELEAFSGSSTCFWNRLPYVDVVPCRLSAFSTSGFPDA